ncbi:MAG: GFA family protein [Gammaproteobacteria bacterium]|nr:GFA family protein [Gammaproteobacteria bacterium]
MKIEGGCHCGDLAYEAVINPKAVGVCHCTDCQTLSGTAFRTAVRVPIEQFTLLRGTPRTYTKVGGSGRPRIMAFCGRCGTQIYGTGEGDGARQISLRVGTSHQRAELKPYRQIWRRSAVSWLNDLGVADSHDCGAD